ncbi:hypothetical protein CVT26_005610 [Gymnopilus dilepis]|uniref:Heme haloperoxidase family profile domain-containing protein n=1 Tax=Gymnopilus dilepis TaxID=231916 RepID=A0A409XZQ6_9AGAR|nr:hypothetical protein CVT26_005610 [Gymnopilus dilepis]
MFASLAVYALLALKICAVGAFPAYESLAGLSREELDAVVSSTKWVPPPPPPGPLTDQSSKLVHDAAHPYQPLQPGDQRGPCPALNTLASHGYLPPLNLENSFARFLVYSTFLVNGNPITNLMSIGDKTSLTGQDPPRPATVAGLDTHNNCEGDTSMTRADAYFGDNHSFNETRFQNMVKFSKKYGAGKYNYTVAAQYRKFLIEDSIKHNPQFSLVSPRLFTAFGESVFPINFFIDGRDTSGQLDLDVARSFFQNMTFPPDFHRRNGSISNFGQDYVTDLMPNFKPGYNAHGVNSYVHDPTSATLTQPCVRYVNFVNRNIKQLYPNPTGILKEALKINLQYLYEATVASGDGCTQVFPYGR